MRTLSIEPTLGDQAALVSARAVLEPWQYRNLLLRRYWQNKIRRVTGYVPTAKQQPVHVAIDLGATRVADEWARRTGKSMKAADEIVIELPFGPPANLPTRLSWITGPESDITDAVFEYVWHWVVDKRCVSGVAPLHKSVRERFIEMPWRSRVEGRTTRNPDSLQGKGLVKIVADEHADDAPEILYTYLIPPTADVAGVVMLTSTPGPPDNHFCLTCDDWLERSQVDPRYFYSHATSYDNPHIDHGVLDEYRRQCERTGNMTTFRREILAERVSRTGAVWPNFRPSLDGNPWHVASVEYDPNQPIYAGVDWGSDHPFVVLFAQLADGDRLRVFHEIVRTGLDPVEQLGLVFGVLHELERNFHLGGRDEPEVAMTYCDPSGLTMKKLFLNANIPVFDPSGVDKLQINSVQAGVEQVSDMFGRHGLPGIEIDPSCPLTITAVQNYSWGPGQKPLKRNDDPCDALRYLAMGVVGIKRGVVMPFY